MVTTAVGAIVGGTISLASQGLQSAVGAMGGDEQQTAQQTSQDQQSREQTIDRIRQEAEQILRDTENPDLQPEALREELDEAQQTARDGRWTRFGIHSRQHRSSTRCSISSGRRREG